MSKSNIAKNFKAIFVLVVILICAVVAGLAINRQPVNAPASQPAGSADDEGQPTPVSTIEGSYIFSGTIVLGRAVKRAAMTSDGYDYSQPFGRLGTLDFDRYDAGIADLECPSTGRHISYQDAINNLVFDCHPDWFEELGKYFQIMNLAGNHTYDAGVEGFRKTVENIQGAGLQAVGHYSPRVKEDLCEVVSMPVRLKKDRADTEVGALPLALCAYHYQFSLSPLPGELEMIRRYAEVMPVIGLMHSGAEYQPKASGKQQNIARKMIDYGAEFVVGNGAHWVQNTEVYKGKLIVYSTGNFIFDQIGYEERLGLSLEANMTLDYDDEAADWLELGAACRPREDDCLRTAKRQGLKRLAPKFTFRAVGSFGGYQRLTEKAAPTQQADIEQRANWQQTLKLLGQTP